MRIAPLMLLAAALAACSQDNTGVPRPLPLDPLADVSPHAGVVGQVYTITNAAAGNVVLAFDRMADGSLSAAGSYDTGGLGTGAGLGDQGALALDQSGKTLVVVDAGSNQLTSFHVNGDGSLTRQSVVSSGGVTPISVTISHGLVYALNAGGAGNIAGFKLSAGGDLTPIANSSRPLSTSAAGPAQVGFDAAGTTLVVTEKNNNVISSYAVNHSGLASGPTVTPSSGPTPFGFAFTHGGTLVVSEAFGGAPNASAVSTYFQRNGAWQVVNASVPTTETSACWIVITNNGRFAYAANAASGTTTGYEIYKSHLTRLDADGVTGDVGAGSGPAEMALSVDSKFLYVVAGGLHTIGAFSVGPRGSLTPLAGAAGLPPGVTGLAAR